MSQPVNPFIGICALLEGREINTFKQFKKFFDQEDSNTVIHNANIVATISSFSSFDSFIEGLKISGFKIERIFGRLIVICQNDRDKKIRYLSFFDDQNNAPLFITTAKKTNQIPETLFRFIYSSFNISHLWIPPKIMKDIKDELIEKNPELIISYFSAIRNRNIDIPAEYRPQVNRSIQYYGLDGKETLNELEYYYGILPKILDIKLPSGVSFRIDNKGIITFKYGSFTKIFEIIENVIQRLEEVREAIGESSYSVNQAGISNQFRTIVQKPWRIHLKKKIGCDEYADIRNQFDSDEWNFTILEETVISKSFFLSARVIDGYSGSLFDITSNGDIIDYYPVKQVDIGSSLRFFEFVLENIDNTALVG
jgi:hypothetical protein